ncbi:MAG TPA: FAD-dependent thymidylate synthase, partial [bacterium]
KLNTGEAFTAEERELLAPYVTNTDASVFALTNLPEVIKGALFSRYSRSTLGLRRLLLKEFIQASEAQFASIAGAMAYPTAGKQSGLAIGKAQDFYDRILDGYGDDSIGELGGAHLAIENVSMIATKVIEDARIGGSPLEKSTRYVSFGQKVDGDYLFYKEPALMASKHAARYVETCRHLFETYQALMEPVSARIAEIAPRSAKTDEKAWRQSVRARTFDVLRGVLPASTVTNMGVFGNGRFFENLMTKLQYSHLAELREIGGAAYQELNKVIPSFVRRANPGHGHFAGYRDHARAQEKAILKSAAALPLPVPEPSKKGPWVRLVDFDPEAEAKINAALFYPHNPQGLSALREWASEMPEVERGALFESLAEARGNRRHRPPRAFELAFFTFDLVGDFGMYRDLHRHRMLTQQRQPLTTRLGYVLPEEVEDAGVAPRYREAMDKAAEAFEAIVADHPAEAQYVVPMQYHIRWNMNVNLRALIWLVELRSQPQGHPAYRRMAQDMFRAVREIQPRLAPLFKFVDMQGSKGGARDMLGRLDAEKRKEQKKQLEFALDESA